MAGRPIALGHPGIDTIQELKMPTSRLNRIRSLMMALLAVFAFGAITAAAAQAATEGPFWTVEGAKLNTNETREITIKAVGSITLEGQALGGLAKVNITCPTATVQKGSYLAGGAPGTSKEVVEFSGEPGSSGRKCAVTGNGNGCTVNEPIRTEPIRNELVVSDGPPAGTFGPFILIEFKPESGSKFVTLNFSGSCTVSTTEVKGEVLGSVYTDPFASVGKPEEQVTTGNQSSLKLTSYLVRFPDPATSIWLLKGGVFVLEKAGKLEAFGEPASLTGVILVLLVNGKQYGSEL
jgi:hypothetical protein